MRKSKLLVRNLRNPLKGEVSVPGDKSISHRAVILAGIADGRSAIRNWLPAGDTMATLDAVKALGVPVEVARQSGQAWDLSIEGKGLFGLVAPQQPLDCRNAGTCMRLLGGLLAGQSFPSVLDGSEQLRQRPMGRIIDPLRRMGATINSANDNDRAPLHISPENLQAISFRMEVASAQVKSAILLAGLYAAGETQVYEPGPTRDHTERMLATMGMPVHVNHGCIALNPANRRLSPLNLTIPGDISSAAFPLVAAMLSPRSAITVAGVGHNPTRTGILDVLSRMEARITAANLREMGGEPVADLNVSFAELRGTDVGGSDVVRGIDEFPIWAVAATQAQGTSIVRDAKELRVKEVDRISALAEQLGKMGAVVAERADGLLITGPVQLTGTHVDSLGDHRLGMALAIAGLVAAGQTVIDHADCIHDSFPAFAETMRGLGADIEWVE